MIIRIELLFLIYTCVNSAEDINNVALSQTNLESENIYKLVNNNVAMLRLQKRESEQNSTSKGEAGNSIQQVVEQPGKGHAGFSEGGNGNTVLINKDNTTIIQSTSSKNSSATEGKSEDKSNNTLPNPKPNPKATEKSTQVSTDPTKHEEQKLNDGAPEANENSPGVVKRGLIVFGGFSVLAIAYFIFYRKKNKNYESNSAHNTNDANQFRYGVLQSDDRRDNLELSRIPLTMESDDDDEEDLQLFDLEEKKKSLSYVNLQTNDEDIVLNNSKDESKNNLLLDIEDGPSDSWADWSNDGNKSIL